MEMLKEEAEELDQRIKLLQKYCLALYLFGSLQELAANPEERGRQNLEMLKEEAEELDQIIKLLRKYCLALYLFGSL